METRSILFFLNSSKHFWFSTKFENCFQNLQLNSIFSIFLLFGVHLYRQNRLFQFRSALLSTQNQFIKLFDFSKYIYLFNDSKTRTQLASYFSFSPSNLLITHHFSCLFSFCAAHPHIKPNLPMHQYIYICCYIIPA